MVTAAAIPWPLSPWHLEHLWEKIAAPSGALPRAVSCPAASPQNSNTARHANKPGVTLERARDSRSAFCSTPVLMRNARRSKLT